MANDNLIPVLHEYGTLEQYKSSQNHDENTLYFINDIGRIYKGDDLLATAIKFFSDIPQIDALQEESLCVVSTDDAVKLYTKHNGKLELIAGGSDAESTVNAIIGVEPSQSDDNKSTILTFTKADGTTEDITIADLFLSNASYNTETKKLELTISGQDEPIEVELPDGSAIWQETAESDNVQKVEFYRCTAQEYNALNGKAKDSAIFFLTDALEIYLGKDNMTSSVIIVDEFPEPETASHDKMYINRTTLECVVRDEGTNSWLHLLPGVLSDGANWADTNNNGMLATIGAIKEGIQATIGEITGVDISSKVDKVDGVKDNVVIFGSNKAIADSGYKIGGAEISEETDDNTIATEKAVMNAIDAVNASCTWKPMNS